MAPLFKCTESVGTKRRLVGEGSEVRAGSQAMGSGERLPYGMSMADVAELAVRTAQLSVVQDVHLRELRTVMTRVAVKADKVDKADKADMADKAVKAYRTDKADNVNKL